MKWQSYLVCFVLIALGVFCGISLYREIKAESYINGSIDISNEFSMESFSYTNTSVVFYDDLYDETDTYSFEKELLKVNDFNGVDKTYTVSLNGFMLLDSVFKAGSVFTYLDMDFYDTNGSIVCHGTLNISIKFLSNKTTLSLAVDGQQQASYFEQYFADNGIRLKVNEMI